MITEEQMNTIATMLEIQFNEELMNPVKEIFEQLESLYKEHIDSGNYKLCKEVNYNFDSILTEKTIKDFKWDGVWFHPSFHSDGTFVNFTKGVGTGCHFGDKDTIKNFYAKYHDDVFGYHFHSTTWGGYEGYSTRKTAIEFVKENVKKNHNILFAKSRISVLANEVLPRLRVIPSLVKEALEKSVEIAKNELKKNDEMLLKEFGL